MAEEMSELIPSDNSTVSVSSQEKRVGETAGRRIGGLGIGGNGSANGVSSLNEEKRRTIIFYDTHPSDLCLALRLV